MFELAIAVAIFGAVTLAYGWLCFRVGRREGMKASLLEAREGTCLHREVHGRFEEYAKDKDLLRGEVKGLQESLACERRCGKDLMGRLLSRGAELASEQEAHGRTKRSLRVERGNVKRLREQLCEQLESVGTVKVKGLGTVKVKPRSGPCWCGAKGEDGRPVPFSNCDRHPKVKA